MVDGELARADVDSSGLVASLPGQLYPTLLPGKQGEAGKAHLALSALHFESGQAPEVCPTILDRDRERTCIAVAFDFVIRISDAFHAPFGSR